MKTFVLLLLVTYVYGQSQNLCGDPPASGFKFVDDPSDCAAYLWCNFNGSALASVHQGTCPTNFLFDESQSACSGSFVCTAACEFNTGTTRVAIASDTICRSYKVCTDTAPGTDTLECPTGSVFNRNFGSCTNARLAPCEGSSGGTPSPQCDGTVNYFNNPDRCSGFFRCEGGVAIDDDCPPNTHFHPDNLFCDDPSAQTPECKDTRAIVDTPFVGSEIPKPPLINVAAAARRRMMQLALNSRL